MEVLLGRVAKEVIKRSVHVSARAPISTDPPMPVCPFDGRAQMALPAPGPVRYETIGAMNRPTATATVSDSSAGADTGLAWQHGFAALGADFFTELRPSPLP